AVFTPIWVGIGWHRFRLLGERPRWWLPRTHGQVSLDYLVGWVKLCIVGFPILLLAAISEVLAVPLTMIAVLFLGVSLPSIAVERPMGLRQGARIGLSYPMAVFTAVVLYSLVGFFIASIVAVQLFGQIGSLATALFLFWFLFMLNISLLTALYRVLIEGRDIP
ncbi:MAG: hypothetical protein AAFX00_08845, partial [Pseudomonadota bacterium]